MKEIKEAEKLVFRGIDGKLRKARILGTFVFVGCLLLEIFFPSESFSKQISTVVFSFFCLGVLFLPSQYIISACVFCIGPLGLIRGIICKSFLLISFNLVLTIFFTFLFIRYRRQIKKLSELLSRKNFLSRFQQTIYEDPELAKRLVNRSVNQTLN